jgi:prepilin-type N-terminal cleavage/methylation domain-containing protein
MLRSQHHRRPGLTLMELVVVMVILAALAALLIPRLGFVKDSADAATAAAGASELANNIEIYKASVGSYPLRMDSLIKDDLTAIYDRFSSTGASASTPTWLTVEDLGTTAGPSGTPGGYWYSVVRSGATAVVDHVAYTAGSDPSSSGLTIRDYSAAPSGTPTNGKTAVVVTTGSTGIRIMEAAGFTATTLPTNVKLVAFGIGPRCGLVGQTMTTVPRHSAQPAEFYGRFIAIFAAYDNGFGAAVKPMQLRCVVDSRGFPVDYRVNQFKLIAPKQE